MGIRRPAFSLLVAGEAIFLGAVVIGGLAYPGYDHGRQYISELGAHGAPTGWAVSWLGFLPSGLLIVGFCLIAAWDLRRRAGLAAGLLLMGWYAYGLVNSAFYPCAFECTRLEPSVTQAMHDLIGGTGYLAGAVGLFVIGAAGRRGAPAWLTPLSLACGGLALVGFSGLVADGEFRGLFQRLLETALVFALLAFGLAWSRGRVTTARS
jgi:hypothetical protein